MRKWSLTLLLIILCCSLVSFADTQKYNPNRPEWDELCPYGMADVTPDTSRHIPGTKAAWKAEEQNYWVQRRQDFEKGLAFCDSVENSTQNACYEKLVAKQQRISAEHVTPEQRWAQTSSKIQQASNIMNNHLYQQEMLNLQKRQLDIQQTNVIMQNRPDYAPKTYNVNLNHNIKYNGF